jgi:ubiquinone biosynthesis protein UbiJ
VPFQPIACGTVDDVLNGFLQRQERIVAALRRCRGRAIDQVKIASPVDSRIRYSIWSSFVVNAAHQRRHLWQAEQAVARAQTAN